MMHSVMYAAAMNGWSALLPHRITRSGDAWVTYRSGDVVVDIKYDRWRHTTARAYRGRALVAVLAGQRALAEFLTT